MQFPRLRAGTPSRCARSSAPYGPSARGGWRPRPPRACSWCGAGRESGSVGADRSQMRSGETVLDSFEALAELVQLGGVWCGRGMAGLGESRGCRGDGATHTRFVDTGTMQHLACAAARVVEEPE